MKIEMYSLWLHLSCVQLCIAMAYDKNYILLVLLKQFSEKKKKKKYIYIYRSAFIIISVVLVIANNAFWGNHLFKVVLLTILTFFQYKINSLLQRRDLRAAALHLLYAGIAKCKSNM